MKMPMMMRIIPPASAVMALSRGPPGKLIQRAQFGLMNATMPKKSTRIPARSTIMFDVSIVSSPFFLFKCDCGAVCEYFCGASHN